ncbi:MAG TPA: hypothetical protein VIX59_13680 [Candidatus Binataceae bacterium]
MKAAARILALLAIIALGFAGQAPAGLKPNLVITKFGLKSWGTCAPGKTVFTFLVTVKNEGQVSWPENLQPTLLVRDLHPGVLDAWGNGYGISPPLAPGESTTIVVEMGYYTKNPKHMTADAPHPFQAQIGPTSYDTSNTFTVHAGPGPALWHGKKVIMVGAPKGCPK